MKGSLKNPGYRAGARKADKKNRRNLVDDPYFTGSVNAGSVTFPGNYLGNFAWLVEEYILAFGQ